MNEIRWDFPNNRGGQIRGVADAGIETFNGNLLLSLVREACQNSLDALDVNQKTVRIEIKNHLVSTSEIPGYNRLKEVITKTLKYWGKQSEKANDFLKRAAETLESSTINVLRISDYNTTGLLEPYEPTLTSGWYSMTKIDGGGTKPGDKNGGFGIGKNAPYANSFLRTIFYRTYNHNEERATQGLARLLSYPEEENNFGSMTTGFGYFGNPENNVPVESIKELDEINFRTEFGTDLFVYGFNNRSSISWKNEVITEVLNNFLVSIYNESLIVEVEGVLLNKEKLPELIEEYIKPNKKTACKTCFSNYLVLTSPNTKIYEKEFHALGTLKLSILVDVNLDLDKRILRTRKSGMKLWAKGNISKMITFSGILEFVGEKLKEYFKLLEPPTHDKWENDRANDPSEAQSFIDELTKWEQDIVWSLGEFSDLNEFNVEGLNDILSLNSNKGNNANVLPEESLEYTLGDIRIIQRPKQKNVKGTLTMVEGTNLANEIEEVNGTIDDQNGIFDTKRTLKGHRKRKRREKHLGIIDENGNEVLKIPKRSGSKCNLKDLRIFKIEDHMYKVIFKLPYSINNGHIEICSIGENNKSNRLIILSARSIENLDNLIVKNNCIEFDRIIGEKKTIMLFELNDNKNYAMEMNVYEH